jgi:hypothetical protein
METEGILTLECAGIGNDGLWKLRVNIKWKGRVMETVGNGNRG